MTDNDYRYAMLPILYILGTFWQGLKTKRLF